MLVARVLRRRLIQCSAAVDNGQSTRPSGAALHGSGHGGCVLPYRMLQLSKLCNLLVAVKPHAVSLLCWILVQALSRCVVYMCCSGNSHNCSGWP